MNLHMGSSTSKPLQWRHVLKRRSAAAVGWFLATLSVVAAVIGGAASRAGEAAARAADIALAIPRRVGPNYVPIGQQVYLRRNDPRRKVAAVVRMDALRVGEQQVDEAWSGEDDPLVPRQAPRGWLSPHRMITYRVRMLEELYHSSTSSSTDFPFSLGGV